ncbi:hypothetical protein EV122DRAFT_203842 [Schizophyllum commune]
MFPKVALLASTLFFGGAVAYNGIAYPYNPDGATFECGQAVQNDANVVFVSAARFDAARCGKEIQATSAYYSLGPLSGLRRPPVPLSFIANIYPDPGGLGDTIYPTLAGVVRCSNCTENDIQLTQAPYQALTKRMPDQPYATVVWGNWN